MEREELAAKSELRRSQWLEAFKKTPDVHQEYQNGTVTYRHPSQFKLRDSDFDHLVRDTPSPIRLKKPRFHLLKTYEEYQGERQARVDKTFNESLNYSSRNRYQVKLSDTQIYRSPMKTYEIQPNHIKLKEKNEVGRIKDTLPIISKSIYEQYLNLQNHQRNSNHYPGGGVQRQVDDSRNSNNSFMCRKKEQWRLTDKRKDSFSKFDFLEREQPYMTRIQMVTRGKTSSPLRIGRVDFSHVLPDKNAAIEPLSSLREHDSLSGLVQFMIVQRNKQHESKEALGSTLAKLTPHKPHGPSPENIKNFFDKTPYLGTSDSVTCIQQSRCKQLLKSMIQKDKNTSAMTVDDKLLTTSTTTDDDHFDRYNPPKEPKDLRSSGLCLNQKIKKNLISKIQEQVQQKGLERERVLQEAVLNKNYFCSAREVRIKYQFHK